MMQYYSTDQAYIQLRKKTCPFCQKAFIQIYYPQLLCPNPIMLHVPLDVQTLVLIAWVGYICMKKKTDHHHLNFTF